MLILGIANFTVLVSPNEWHLTPQAGIHLNEKIVPVYNNY